MLASRISRPIWPGLLLGVCGLVRAADNEMPEAELLEYLGTWVVSDVVWRVFNIDKEPVAKDSDTRVDPVPQGEESTEKDDEG
jgi:hypothetical protein